MPRIDSTNSAAGGGFAIPWKVIAVVLLIGCVWGYTWYQYVRLHPKPSRSAAVAAAARESSAKERGIAGELAAVAEKLKLSDDQKSSISTIVKITTNPREIRREVARVLTKEQRGQAREMLVKEAGKRKAIREKRQERIKRYLPGSDLEWAKQAQQQVREQTAERRKAAEEAGQKPAGAKE